MPAIAFLTHTRRSIKMYPLDKKENHEDLMETLFWVVARGL